MISIRNYSKMIAKFLCRHPQTSYRRLLALLACLSITGVTMVDEQQSSGKGENASNPLAKVKSTDLEWQHFELTGDPERNDYQVNGSFMATRQTLWRRVGLRFNY